jgi:hypothetical protein
MASFHRDTNRVTLSGEEMFNLAKFILNNVDGGNLEDVYSEVSFGHIVDNEKPHAWFRIHKQNRKGFKEKKIEFEIDVIFPDYG